MPAIETGPTRDPIAAQPPPRRATPIRLLLAFGVAASLLYVATDIVGGLRYPGYDFTSQAISELGAIGAPSQPLMFPLFLVYNLLMVAFGVAVFREAAGRNRPLRVTGALLFLYGALGLPGALFPMQQRGAGSIETDLPHIVATGVLVLLMLAALAFGASALGRRFRLYSWATLLAVAALTAWTGTYATRLAANRPTPGLGIVERLDVYAWLLWVAVLAMALLRRPRKVPKEAVP